MIGYIKDINELFRSDLTRVLDNTLFEPTKEEAIDYFNRFVGRVVNNNDSDNLGRCQVRVFGLFSDEIEDKDLPWATPDMDFIGSKKGSFIIPPVGALVNVYFHKGDIYQPHYTTKVIDSKNLPSRRLTDTYPNNMVFFETDEGDYFEIDRTDGTTDFHHRSGTEIIIFTDGSIKIDCKGSSISIKGAKTAEFSGEDKTSLGGNKSVLYSTTDTPPTDSHGVPIQGIGISKKTTVSE